MGAGLHHAEDRLGAPHRTPGATWCSVGAAPMRHDHSHRTPLSALPPHCWRCRWLAGLLPLLSLYLHETSAVKLCNSVERIQKTSALSHLAWLVTSELDCWFEWCHPEETEARLVLLSPDQQTAMVMSRSMGPTRVFDPLTSIDVLISGGVRSGAAHLNSRGRVGSADELGNARREAIGRTALSSSTSMYRPVSMHACERGLWSVHAFLVERCMHAANATPSPPSEACVCPFKRRVR